MRRWTAAAHVIAGVVSVVVAAGCVFAPNVAQYGYVPCGNDADCEVGRSCDEKLCAPPQWNDEAFGDRRLLSIANIDDAPIAAGTAIPVGIGGEGDLLTLDDVGNDLRFTDFDTTTNTWNVVSVFLDRESDRFTAWIPAQRIIEQGKSDVLAWIESDTREALATVIEDPNAAFLVFENFDDALDETVWSVQGTGGTPVLDRGLINVADNQSILLTTALQSPVTVTFLARINGINCDEVFIGLVGDDDSIFATPPEAGIFVDEALQASVRLAPTADSVPTDVAAAVVGTAFARYTVSVDTNAVNVSIDDVVAHEDLDLRPPFGFDPLFLTVQVGGACSVDVDTLWVTSLPLPRPSVTASERVEFKLFP